MSIHNHLQSIQMASTACIYNLTRTPLTEQINIKYLAKILQAIINVMEIFPNQQQVNIRFIWFFFQIFYLFDF
jgi:hypothetical protein